MPNGTTQQLRDLLSGAIEDIIASVGRGIGEAQAALDTHSIEVQRLIDQDPLLSQYNVQATWYQIPSTQVQLKVALDLQERTAQTAAPGTAIAGAARPPRLLMSPINARYLNQFAFDAQAATTVSLSFVPVPPPGPPTPAARTETEIRQIAAPNLKSDDPAHPHFRLTVNYNAGARSWTVLQTSETAGQVTLEAMARIDDVTGAVTSSFKRP